MKPLIKNHWNKSLQLLWTWIKRYKWIAGAMLGTILLAVLGYLFIIFGGRFVIDEKALILPVASKVVLEDGTIIGKIYSENREYVTLQQIPDHVENAFITLEDKRFYDHAGVSFISVARAVYRDIISMSKEEGASTITQQLAKNLFLTNDKSWMRKTKEVMASIYLERNLSKQQILELYLNEVYFGHGIHGVGTAANYFFGKNVDELTVDEGAMLAGMIKAPNTYSPYKDIELAKARRNVALAQLEKEGYLSTEQLIELQAKSIKVIEQKENREPWMDDYFDYVIYELNQVYDLNIETLKRGGYTIQVHMDPALQEIAYKKIQDDDYFKASNDDVNTGFVLMDEETGALKVLIAGRDFQYGKDHNMLRTRKQPGSVLKPLAVYAPALDTEKFTPYSMLKDQDLDYDGYRVRNADGIFAGEIALYHALVYSKNTSAVWVLNEIGIPLSKTYLNELGMEIEDDGLAIALGGLTYGVTPIQLVEGYRTFIHGGQWIPSTSIQQITDRNGETIALRERDNKRVFQPQTAWNMVRMLEKTVQEGTAKAGEFQKALAGKTGTTEHPTVEGKAKDVWFAGFTAEYVTVSWIGYESANDSNYLTAGSSEPTRLTKAILTDIDKLQAQQESFVLPKNVKELEEPIELPEITDLTARLKFGGYTIIQAQLEWTAAPDNRVIYQIYRKEESGSHTYLGEVQGKGEYTLNGFELITAGEYLVIPYNPLTDESGSPSNSAKLSFDF